MLSEHSFSRSHINVLCEEKTYLAVKKMVIWWIRYKSKEWSIIQRERYKIRPCAEDYGYCGECPP